MSQPPPLLPPNPTGVLIYELYTEKASANYASLLDSITFSFCP